MNLIPKICELLGVEIGEEFKLKSNELEYAEIYCLMEDGLVFKDKYGFSESCRFKGLITGDFEIIKIPFEPKDGEIYWCVRWSYNSGLFIISRLWDETLDACWFDKNCNNRFRTEAEAEREKYNVYKRLTGKEWKINE